MEIIVEEFEDIKGFTKLKSDFQKSWQKDLGRRGAVRGQLGRGSAGQYQDEDTGKGRVTD